MKLLTRFAKCAFIFLCAVGVGLLGLWLFNSPSEFEEASQSRARLGQAEYKVGKLDLKFTDSTRKTPALGEFSGADKRVLKGSIWYPKNDLGGLPLIVYSHGFAGKHNESKHIAEYLASNGYVVAAVNFPLSNGLSPAGVPQLLDVVNQPGDVSAVIDHVLQLSRDSESDLFQRIDADNIGVMGLSLGGLTTALVSFHPDMMDQRIKASVMMAPPLDSFSEQFFAGNSNVKTLLLSGSLDRVVPESINAVQVMPRHARGWFISLDKGTHLGFANIGNPIRWMQNPDDLGCALMGMMLARLDLPERWDELIPNPQGVLRDVEASLPCPEMPGDSMNSLKQQWLTRIAIGSFFDMHLRSGARAERAAHFFTESLAAENPEVSLTLPRF